MIRTVIVAALVCVMVAGCSATTAIRYIEADKSLTGERPECSGNAGPVMDTVVAAALLTLGAVGYAAGSEECGEDSYGCGWYPDEREVGTALLWASIPFVVAAPVGFYFASKCRKLQKQWTAGGPT